MNLDLISEYPTGGDPVHLAELGNISRLRYSDSYPGGPWACSFDLDVPPDYSRLALAPGRRLSIYLAAALVWRGHLEEPTPGIPWGMTARGIAQDSATVLALPDPLGPGNALDLDDVIDEAISRGALSWTRSGGFPTFGSDLPGMKLSDALTTVGDRTGKVWHVSPDGVATMTDPPTTPDLILAAERLPGGRTLYEFANAIKPVYMNGGVRTLGGFVIDQPSIDKFGRVEQVLDMTGLGDMSGVTAAAAAAKVLAKVGARTRFSQPLIAAPGQLLTLGGAPTEIALVRAGRMVRVVNVDASRQGEVKPGGAVETVIALAEYDADTDTVTLTPRETVRRSLSTLLAPQRRTA